MGRARGPVDPLVSRTLLAGRAFAHLEVVDLFEFGLVRVGLVVLVRRVRRPVAGRRQYLAGDQPVRVERRRHAKVDHPPRAVPGAADSTATRWAG